MDRALNVRLATQIADELRQKLLAGKYKPGQGFPTERELIDIYGVSRPVIRDAVAKLRREGLLVVHRGVGTVVANSVNYKAPAEGEREPLPRPGADDDELLDSVRAALNQYPNRTLSGVALRSLLKEALEATVYQRFDNPRLRAAQRRTRS